MKNYYKILGVSPDAEDIVIKAAYKALAQRYHPDKWVGNAEQANRKMVEINEAYAVLSDSIRRQLYDDEFLSDEAEVEDASHGGNGGASSKEGHYCDLCGDLISGKLFKVYERVDVGGISGTQRSGLFDFNVFNWKYSDQKIYQNVWKFYCETCYLLRKRNSKKMVAISIGFAAIIFLVVYLMGIFSGEGSKGANGRLLYSSGQHAAQSSVVSYVIQIGVFSSEDKANSWIEKLDGENIPSYLIGLDLPNGSISYVLRAGPFNDVGAAENAVDRLKLLGINPRIVEAPSEVRQAQGKAPMGERKVSTVENQEGVGGTNSTSRFSPSFDCAKALHASEVLICEDAELSGLDVKLSNAYKNTIKFGDAEKLKREQVMWIKSSRACKTKDCLLNAYNSRITELLDR